MTDTDKINIVQVAYDGITSHYCGCGTISRAFTRSIPYLDTQIESELTYNVITPLNHEGCLGYNQEVFETTEQICESYNGRIRYISDNSEGYEQFGRQRRWLYASSSAAGQIIDIVQHLEGRTLVFVHDACFMASTWLSAKQLQNQDVQIVYIPHSTSKNQSRVYRDNFEEWLEWEQDNFQEMEGYQNIKVGIIGKYMRKHLSEDYDIENNFVDVINGLHPDMYDLDFEECFKDLGLEDKNSFVAFGRSERYKGLEKLAESYSLDTQLVVVASDQTSLDPADLNKVDKGENVKVIDRFLPSKKLYSLIADSRTIGVVTPSLSEPFGLIPEEARILPGRTVPISSNVDGLKYQIEHGENGFLFDHRDEDSLEEVLNFVEGLSEQRLVEIDRRGGRKFSECYDYRKNLVSAVRSLV